VRRAEESKQLCFRWELKGETMFCPGPKGIPSSPTNEVRRAEESKQLCFRWELKGETMFCPGPKGIPSSPARLKNL